MRKLTTTDKQHSVRLHVGVLGAALVLSLGVCTAPAMAQSTAQTFAQESVSPMGNPVMQLAMLPGNMMQLANYVSPLSRTLVDTSDALAATPASDDTQAAVIGAQDTPAADSAQAVPQASELALGNLPLSAARIDDEQLGSQRGRNLQGGAMLRSPSLVAVANGVTLWDELPGAVVPTPRPQQVSNGVGNVQVMQVTYSTR